MVLYQHSQCPAGLYIITFSFLLPTLTQGEGHWLPEINQADLFSKIPAMIYLQWRPRNSNRRISKPHTIRTSTASPECLKNKLYNCTIDPNQREKKQIPESIEQWPLCLPDVSLLNNAKSVPFEGIRWKQGCCRDHCVSKNVHAVVGILNKVFVFPFKG